MATGNDDEKMLYSGEDNSTMQQFPPPQPHPSPPTMQQPYAGAAMAPAGPPGYPYPQPGAQAGYAVGGQVPMSTMSTHNTTVVVTQPPAPQVTGPRMWSSSLCACCDDAGSCLLGVFCPCILATQIAQDLDESCCVPCCVPGWLIVLRTKLRMQNNIQGTVMDDCCTVCCCGNCVMCQMAREIKFIRRTAVY